ncbi:MAG: GMC oxidoreductase [Betaproteobacteria bacterium]
MIGDITRVPDGATFEADLCVIGGGPAAIALALEFAGDRRKVVVLESGGLSFDRANQDSAAGEQTGIPYFDLADSRFRLFGGSTFRWGARTAPLQPGDFARRDWIERSGWPLSRAELDPYYERAYDLIGLHRPFAFDANVWKELGRTPPAFDASLLEYAAFQFGKNLLFGDVYRGAIDAAANVEVLLGAHVLALQANARGDHIDSLDVGHRGGGRWSVKARHYVLASGGIENARLLLLSARSNPAGLCNRNDLVGRCFIEHPTVSAGAIVSDHWQVLQDAGSPGLVHGRLVEVGLALTPEVQRRERCLNAVARTAVKVGSDATQALRELLWNARHRRLPHQLDWYQKNQWLTQRLRAVASDPVSIVANVVRHALGKPKRFNVESVYLELRIEQEPNPDSRVTLGDATDAFGQRRARLHWALTERDKRTMRVAAQVFQGELRRLQLGELAIAPWLVDDDLSFPADMVGGHHHMGTTRMADDPSQGVVDADCRAFELDNLFVAGSSVFPTGGFVNPTATLLALALRLADHLKRTTA